MNRKTTSARPGAARARWLLKGLIVLAVAAALARPGAAVAPAFTLDWYTVDGGGAINAAGGTLALSGTAGQPDAARLTGTGLSLQSGFWGAYTGSQVYVPDARRARQAGW